MFWRAFAFTLVVSSVFAGAASAQTEPASPTNPSDDSSSTASPGAKGKFELSPFIGVRTAGSFRGEEQSVVYQVGSAATFGVLFDYFLTDQLALEALWSHQSSDLSRKEAFVTATGGDSNEETLFDIGVDYVHGGIRYGAGNEKYDPYVAAGVGLGRLSPDGPDATSVSKFSLSFGAGLVAQLNDRIAVRAEARAFGTRGGDGSTDLFCDVFGCVTFERATTFWQSHFIGAVVIGF